VVDRLFRGSCSSTDVVRSCGVCGSGSPAVGNVGRGGVKLGFL
jgi:hypothetical protein